MYDATLRPAAHVIIDELKAIFALYLDMCLDSDQSDESDLSDSDCEPVHPTSTPAHGPDVHAVTVENARQTSDSSGTLPNQPPLTPLSLPAVCLCMFVLGS